MCDSNSSGARDRQQHQNPLPNLTSGQPPIPQSDTEQTESGLSQSRRKGKPTRLFRSQLMDPPMLPPPPPPQPQPPPPPQITFPQSSQISTPPNLFTPSRIQSNSFGLFCAAPQPQISIFNNNATTTAITPTTITTTTTPMLMFKSKRGRPAKNKEKSIAACIAKFMNDLIDHVEMAIDGKRSVKRGPGRPPKSATSYIRMINMTPEEIKEMFAKTSEQQSKRPAPPNSQSPFALPDGMDETTVVPVKRRPGRPRGRAGLTRGRVGRPPLSRTSLFNPIYPTPINFQPQQQTNNGTTPPPPQLNWLTILAAAIQSDLLPLETRFEPANPTPQPSQFLAMVTNLIQNPSTIAEIRSLTAATNGLAQILGALAHPAPQHLMIANAPTNGQNNPPTESQEQQRVESQDQQQQRVESHEQQQQRVESNEQQQQVESQEQQPESDRQQNH